MAKVSEIDMPNFSGTATEKREQFPEMCELATVLQARC
jgi:hypothetical protein